MVFTNVDDAFLRANATVPRNVGLSNVGTGASYGCRKKNSRESPNCTALYSGLMDTVLGGWLAKYIYQRVERQL